MRAVPSAVASDAEFNQFSARVKAVPKYLVNQTTYRVIFAGKV